jgi:hypothetical protein
MQTTNVPTLKINKLSKAQFERELAAGNINENELYLTPDDEGGSVSVDATLSIADAPADAKATGDALAEKAPLYTYGSTDLQAGVTPLETGKLHFVYE